MVIQEGSAAALFMPAGPTAGSHVRPRSLDELTGLLATFPLFAGMDEAGRREVALHVEPVSLAGGEPLMLQGDAGDSMYLVVTGRLQAFIDRSPDPDLVLGEIGRGEAVGEMAVITGESRSASVRAIRDTELLRLTSEASNLLVHTQPETVIHLTRSIITRLRGQALRRADALATIAVIPAGRHAPVIEFTHRLARALSAIGPTLHLTSERLDHYLGHGAAQTPHGGAEDSRIIGWLNAQETLYQYVIYEAEDQPSPWTVRSVRQADRVILVGRSGESESLSEVEAHVQQLGLQSLVPSVLVLVHDDGAAPAGTAGWLAPRQAVRHLHVRAGSASDVARVARTLTGHTVAAALGGGGARGYAHIGILRALEECGVPVDAVGGTSAGSIVSAQYAAGWGYQEMVDRNREYWSHHKPTSDRTLPLVAMLEAKNISRMLVQLFGETRIEDLWLTYFCVTANLTRAAMRVHRDGPVWRAVRASGSVPGVAPPVIDNGDLIVDGGVLNNLPADIMRSIHGGAVIACDVSPRVEMATSLPDTESLSGWHLLRSRLNPWSKNKDQQIPDMLSILTRTAMLASISTAETMKTKSDLYLHPPTDHYGMFEVKAIAEIARTGYEYALDEVGKWRDSWAPLAPVLASVRHARAGGLDVTAGSNL
ncbi:MAG TPA: cyclic nucleotide-binding and patatin-like phospholipase domain-containing protein [Chloroflexota bacterium]|nr:cyclic nucleotide-binding and patatin-like phospholipase domain-containing protein [Chloroflexota bacterium]